MSGGMFALIVVLSVICGVAFAIYKAREEARRREALASWALSKKLTFSPDRVNGMKRRFPLFDCLRQGSYGYALNVMEGDYAGRPILAFDCHREMGSRQSKGRTQHDQYFFSAVVLFSPVPLKPLLIRSEEQGDKLASVVGSEPINFELAEFNRKFFVKSPDRKWAYDVLHARTIEFLLASPQFKIQLEPRCVIAWRDARFTAPEFEQAAEVAKGILDRLPEYVVKQQQAEG